MTGNPDQVFTENDNPNFFGSSYSIVKGFTDQIMRQLQDTVLNCRIRMPISSDRSPRNFVTKITTYEKICSIPNSMTVLEEILPIMIDMAKNKTVGTFNINRLKKLIYLTKFLKKINNFFDQFMTNPGKIAHNEILEMYKEIVNPEFTWKNFTQEEQRKILAADRSNNELTTDKLKNLYPALRPIHEAVKATLEEMKNN